MKKGFIMLAAAATAAAGALSTALPVSADSALRSRGSLAVEEEELDLCASDIEYLQSEIRNLSAELPDTGNEMPYDIIKDTVRRNQIKSDGIIDYAGGTVILDASDLKYLADEIDTLEASYKMLTAQALGKIGTYFRPDATLTYESEEAAPLEVCVENLSFDKIREGILQSQSVAHLAAKQAVNGAGEALFYVNEEAQDNKRLDEITTNANDYPLMIQAACAENLSAGTAAWVDGKLIIGNGADNQAYYNKGYDTGGEEAIKHIYGGESFMEGYPDVCSVSHFGSGDPLWTEASDSKYETYQIPLIDGQGRILYGISFQCRYRARQHLNNVVAASGSYTLSTKEGTVIESSGYIEATPYPVDDLAFTCKNVYIDLFSKSFATEDEFLYLQLQGNTYARYVEFNVDGQAHADFHFVDIVAKYK